MAGVSLLDLILAKAFAEGLAREQAQRQQAQPLPENVFVIPNASVWYEVKEACQTNNKVFVVNITDGSNYSCRRVDNIFINLAREFDSLPFFHVEVGPFETHDQLRQDLGNLQYTPTILVGFYGNSLGEFAVYQGEAEIQNGLLSGHLQAQINEYISKSTRCKLIAEHARVVEGLVQDLKLGEEYEQRLAEAEERKALEDKKRQEKEEQDRQEYLEHLLKMDLTSSPTKEIKDIMIKLGISPDDCLERSDLIKKLKENVPELKDAPDENQSGALKWIIIIVAAAAVIIAIFWIDKEPSPHQAKILDVNSHLKYLVTHTNGARNKWKDIGVQLNLNNDVLNTIQRDKNQYDDNDYYREMLIKWMQTGEARMEDLLTALDVVGMKDIANKEREKKKKLGL